MREDILIVEDEFIVANDLRIILEKAGYHISGIAPSYTKAMELLAKKQPDWVLVDIFLKGDKTGIDLACILNNRQIPFIYISANTNQTVLESAKATAPYGFLVKPFREKDLLVMLDIAQYRHKQHFKLNEQQGNVFVRQIEQIISGAQLQVEKLKQLAFVLQSVLPFQLLSFRKTDGRGLSQDIVLLNTSDGAHELIRGNELPVCLGVSARDTRTWQPRSRENAAAVIFNGYHFKKERLNDQWLSAVSNRYGLGSALLLPATALTDHYEIGFFDQLPEAFTAEHAALLQQMLPSLASIIASVISIKDIPANVSLSPHQPNKPVLPEAKTNFHGIIGHSPLLTALLERIKLVAPTDTSVLILGESGTGKERIAQTIHALSPRKSRPLVVINCAALPVNLIESELFGHEKGAFTGAGERRTGKFELADGGTVFLDEIGELPLEAQVKLLRVLQEKEIERLGGSQTRKINVRVVAATNRNLEKEVAEGRFRLDLYYRLNVFPIALPPLRERKEDIPLLSAYFLEKYAQQQGKTVARLSGGVMDLLMNYDWPGNIRELEHLIEKSVLLNSGTEITAVELPLGCTGQEASAAASAPVQTMEELERTHIMNVLALCRGKVFGPGGAAEMLNIPSTTLNSKIRKLGIKYEFVKE